MKKIFSVTALVGTLLLPAYALDMPKPLPPAPKGSIPSGNTGSGIENVKASATNGAGVGITRNLSLGSSGDEVVALQAYLEQKGFLTMPEGAARGYFGSLTKRALMNYQKEIGLEQTGTVGPKTRESINRNGGAVSAQGVSIPQAPAAPSCIAIPGSTSTVVCAPSKRAR